MISFVPMLLSPGGGRPGTPLKEVRGVVVHWTANLDKGADALANRSFFESLNKNPNPVSAHYIVDDKRIVQCVPETEVTYHCGAKKYNPDALALLGPYPNATTISVESCVNVDGNGGDVYKNTVGLCGDIVARHNLLLSRLFTHFMVTGKHCPAYFVEDEWAEKMGFGGSAEAAWQTFRRDVRIAARACEVAAARKGVVNG